MIDNDIYDRGTLNGLFGRAGQKNKGIRHQETCPSCGRTLVNLYKSKTDKWLCRRCCERVDNLSHGLTERRNYEVINDSKA